MMIMIILFFNYFISVGFFMYMERKFIGLGQYRLGPNKVFFKGYVQFIYDMFKLLNKCWVYLNNLIFYFYYLLPFMLFLNMIIMWMIIPMNINLFNMLLSFIYLLVLMVLKIYYLILLIFYLYSIYSIISVIRMVIQIISYDIIIILLIMNEIMIYSELSMMYIFNNLNLNLFQNLFIFIFWFISILVELIRLPFDFYEGESELISGFNIEFSSFEFLILVLIEYMEMIYFIILTIFFFFFGLFDSIIFYVMVFILIYMLIWFRVFLIRYRFDKMLILMWKFLFPLLMIIIMFNYIYFYV